MSDIKLNYIPTKSGTNTIEVNGYLLHSKYDPMKEAERIVEKEFKENYVHVLFGYGLGYIAKLLKSKLSGKEELIIIEPLKEIFDATTNDEIIYIEEQENLKNKIQKLLDNNRRDIKVICSPNYDKIALKAYRELLKKIKDIQSLNIVEENTVRAGSELWQENYIKNLLYVAQDASLSDLEKAYDCPVVIASGGPSLTKQLPLLKKIRNKIILIASGSTINSLLKENIEPDYVVTIDGAESNYLHFKGLSLKNASLIYCLSSNYKIQHEYKGERFPFLPPLTNQVKQRIEEELSISLPFMPGGGSVANFAFTIATYITNGPIALIGQDLAYTENLTHAENNKRQKLVDDSFYKNRNAFQVEGYFGDKVMTDYVFESMKNSFEKLQKSIKHSAPIFNCTEGGVKIDGFEQITFKDYIDSYVGEETISKVISEGRNGKPQTLVLKTMLTNEIKRYEQLERLWKEAITAIKMDKLKLKFSKATIKKLNKVDTRSKKLLKSTMMNDIIKPIMMDVMREFKEKQKETNTEKFERIYNQNIMLYSQLLEVTKKSKQFTLEAISTLKRELTREV